MKQPTKTKVVQGFNPSTKIYKYKIEVVVSAGKRTIVYSYDLSSDGETLRFRDVTVETKLD